MKIKIIALTICILLISMAAKAQTTFGILERVNFQNINGTESDGDKLNNDLIVGFLVGMNVMIPVAPDFYFNPVLLFSVKGAENENLGITSTYKINYLEMPLNLTYKAKLGNGHILLGFGTSLGFRF